MQKNEVDCYLISYKKINSKQIKDLNMETKTIKHLEKAIGQKLHDTEFNSDFLGKTPKACAMKVKSKNKRTKKPPQKPNWDFIKIKTFFHIKWHYQHSEKQLMEWEKTIYKSFMIRELISRIY